MPAIALGRALATSSWAQPIPNPRNQGLHLGWENKPNHVEILTQPISQVVDLGKGVTLTVEAEGKPAVLHYEWKKDGAPVGGDAPIFEIGAITPDMAGSYTVTVSNPTGSVTSTPAILLVHTPPTIQTQPQSQTVLPPDSVTFSVVAISQAVGGNGFEWHASSA